MTSLVVSFLSWSAGPAVSSRRDVLLAGFGAGAALSLPAPALAQRSGLIPRQSKEATDSFREFQLSKPSEETEAFKQAEKRRNSGTIGAKPKEESADETMKRLGIKSYGDSMAAGNPDPCAPGSFACGRGR